nr:MAG: hypothetical protein [Molluscum contagiosum virus]
MRVCGGVRACTCGLSGVLRVPTTRSDAPRRKTAGSSARSSGLSARRASSSSGRFMATSVSSVV